MRGVSYVLIERCRFFVGHHYLNCSKAQENKTRHLHFIMVFVKFAKRII